MIDLGIYSSKDGKEYACHFIPDDKKAIAIGPLPEGVGSRGIAFEVSAGSEQEARVQIAAAIQAVAENFQIAQTVLDTAVHLHSPEIIEQIFQTAKTRIELGGKVIVKHVELDEIVETISNLEEFTNWKARLEQAREIALRGS